MPKYKRRYKRLKREYKRTEKILRWRNEEMDLMDDKIARLEATIVELRKQVCDLLALEERVMVGEGLLDSDKKPTDEMIQRMNEHLEEADWDDDDEWIYLNHTLDPYVTNVC